MEPLAVACVVCLWIVATVRFIAWTRRWERQWDQPADVDDELPFPGDEWKYGTTEDEEDERA